VDEAQNMAAETLEELRMLSNINADKDQALQVILVGQRELRDTLRRPDLVQFAQRISVDYHLDPLSEEETVGYIRHRLKTAGGDPQLFEESACRHVYRYSNGIPRLINLLCDTALVYGYAEQRERIDSALITDVAREKQQGGIFPTFHPAPSAEQTAAAPQTTAITDNDPGTVTATLPENTAAHTGPPKAIHPRAAVPAHHGSPQSPSAGGTHGVATPRAGDTRKDEPATASPAEPTPAVTRDASKKKESA
jgi:hypothetical protein